MKVYQDYANYYDVLYGYKNYLRECDFLKKVFKKYKKEKSLSILDLGCGTGSHALILAGLGHNVTGVDLSAKMIRIARGKTKKVVFKQGDVRKLNIKKKFDVVLLMFNVIGYQTTDRDLLSVFKTAGLHLKEGGLLVFDCWSGPAVLEQLPEDRLNIIDFKKGEKLVKMATPYLDRKKKTVDIKYKVLRVKGSKVLDEVNETHKLRYLFPKEIENYLKKTGFLKLEICPFLELNKKPSLSDWNISIIAKKI